MNKKINILIDSSGSILEFGKSHVVKYLLYTLKRIFEKEYLDYEISFFSWSDSIYKLDDIENLKFEGSLSALALNESIDTFKSVKSVLFISDGSFNKKIQNAFEEIKNNGVNLYCMSIGIDANSFNLKKISSYKEVFIPEEVVRAVFKMCRYEVS